MPSLSHTYDCPDTNAILTEDPVFTTFTRAEATECILNYTAQIKLPPLEDRAATKVFAYWEFQVSDGLSNTYTWWDFNLAEDASKATIKSAIKDHLCRYVRKLTTDGTSDRPGQMPMYDYAGVSGTRATTKIKGGAKQPASSLRSITLSSVLGAEEALGR